MRTMIAAAFAASLAISAHAQMASGDDPAIVSDVPTLTSRAGFFHLEKAFGTYGLWTAMIMRERGHGSACYLLAKTSSIGNTNENDLIGVRSDRTSSTFVYMSGSRPDGSIDVIDIKTSGGVHIQLYASETIEFSDGGLVEAKMTRDQLSKFEDEFSAGHTFYVLSQAGDNTVPVASGWPVADFQDCVKKR